MDAVKRKRRRLGHQQFAVNRLFIGWVEELRDEARERGVKSQYAYSKAVNSLKKYPLPLSSGEEAKILDHIGNKLAAILSKRLSEYEAQQSSSPPPSLAKRRWGSASSPTPSHPPPKAKRRRSVHEYVPQYRSGPYSILIALLEAQQTECWRGHLSKAALIEKATPHSDTSFTIAEDGSYYTAWSSMAQLIRKGLVNRWSSPVKFCLTEAGEAMALSLLAAHTTAAAAPAHSSSPKNRPIKKPTVPTVIEIRDSTSPSPSTDTTEPYSIEERSTAAASSSGSPSPLPSSQCCSGSRVVVDLSSSSSSSSGEEGLPVVATPGVGSTTPAFILKPGEFEVLLCVDNAESTACRKSSSQFRGILLQDLAKNGVLFDVRRLSVGDFLWVARDRVATRPVPGSLALPRRREAVLEHIVERKRMDDLAGSIMDGRCSEQKFRLKGCGVRHPVYLVEEYGDSCHLKLPERALQQAIANTQVTDGFYVKRTHDVRESVAYLTLMSRHLQQYYANKTIKVYSMDTLENDVPTMQPQTVHCMAFDQFNQASVKSKALSVRETFARQLIQLPFFSADKAVSVLHCFPTVSHLQQAYRRCSTDRERLKLCADIRAGECNRRLGDKAGKLLRDLYWKP